MQKSLARVLAGVILLWGSTAISAQWLGPGCWYCKDAWPVGTIDQFCELAGHGETGDGLDCREGFDGWGYTCYVPPDPCYNEDASGGGGGGGGGGGSGTTCLIRVGRLCPAQCFSCDYIYI